MCWPSSGGGSGAAGGDGGDAVGCGGALAVGLAGCGVGAGGAVAVGGGTGGGWVEPGAYEINLPFRPMEESAPVAVFLEIQTRTDEGQALSSQRLGPVVLQLLPDAQGIARLDQ